MIYDHNSKPSKRREGESQIRAALLEDSTVSSKRSRFLQGPRRTHALRDAHQNRKIDANSRGRKKKKAKIRIQWDKGDSNKRR